MFRSSFNPKLKKIKLLKQALACYEDDGTAAYRDAISDLCWIAYKAMPNIDIGTVVVAAKAMFIAELEEDLVNEEYEKVMAIPAKDLPLYLNCKWKYHMDSVFKNRLTKELGQNV
jgi:hypothetical protein